MIWISQIIGATLGVLWVRFTAVVKANEMEETEVLSPIARIAPNDAYLMDDGTVYYGYILMVEIFATFVFVSCCLSLAHQGSTEKPLNALTVSLSLYLSIQLAGNLSGGSLNPAIGLVQSLFQHQFANTKLAEEINTTFMCLVHVLGPLCGGILAAPVHLYLTDSKESLENHKVKSFLKVQSDNDVPMTERKMTNNTDHKPVNHNIREGMRHEVDHGY
jgi:glycerol uptake facilitator-like aquaporin